MNEQMSKGHIANASLLTTVREYRNENTLGVLRPNFVLS